MKIIFNNTVNVAIEQIFKISLFFISEGFSQANWTSTECPRMKSKNILKWKKKLQKIKISTNVVDSVTADFEICDFVNLL
jgi:hypothetical protein